MDTKVIHITGEDRAAALVLRLINLSQWFTLEPLPDDEWHLTVKRELPFATILDTNLGHRWRVPMPGEPREEGHVCDECELGASAWADKPSVCPWVEIPVPLAAYVIGDNRGGVHRVALVGHSTSADVEGTAEYFDHSLVTVTPDYCRTDNDAVRLLYNMNDQPEPHIRLEYDKDYKGGNYNGTGQYLYLSAIDIDPGNEDEVYEAFEAQTELPRSCVIHYSEDERFTEDGSPLDS